MKGHMMTTIQIEPLPEQSGKSNEIGKNLVMQALRWGQ
jgi:hypothetical protein